MGVLGLVAGLLAWFVLLVSAYKAQVQVVRQRTQEDKRAEVVGGVQEEERDVDERVTKVARHRLVCYSIDMLGFGSIRVLTYFGCLTILHTP